MQKKWGVAWDVSESGLVIREVLEGGFLHKWNRDQPERQSHVGDCICQVGSFRTDGRKRSWRLAESMMSGGQSEIRLGLERSAGSSMLLVYVKDPWR